MMIKILKNLHFLTIVLLPLYIVRFQLWGLPVTLLEVFILICAVGSFFYAVSQGEIKMAFGKIDFLVGFFLISAGLALFITPDLRGGLGIYKAYFVEPVLFFYSLGFVIRKEKSNIFVIRALIVSTFCVCLLGLVQKITGEYTFAPQEMRLGRISGVYNSANAVALFIGPVVSFLAVLFIKHQERWKKSIFLVLLLFYSLVMYWTRSRGGLIAELFSLSIIVFGLLATRSRRLKRMWLVLPLLTLLLSILFFWQVNSIYERNTIGQNPVRIQNDTIQIRYATWYSSLQMLSSSPIRFIFGVGLNGFKTSYDQYKLQNFPEDFQYPHNFVLTFWSETGLFGLTSFLLLLGYFFYQMIRLNKKQIDLFSLALIGGFSFMLIHGLVDVPYFKNDLSVEFWVLGALVGSMHNGRRKLEG